MQLHLSRQLVRLHRHRASVLTIAAVVAMFALALAWLQANAPTTSSLRAVAGAPR